MFSDDLKKFVKILEFCDAGPYSSEELEQALRRIVLFPAHVKRYIDLLKLEVVAFHLEWPDPELKWQAGLLGTDILKLRGIKGDTIVKMELPLKAYGNIMMVAGFTGWETEAPQPHPDPSQIKVMEFVRNGPWEIQAFMSELRKVCKDQLQFTVLQHSVMEVINRFAAHTAANHSVNVTINESRDMLCFEIGHFAGQSPAVPVYAELGVVNDELLVIGEFLMAHAPSGKEPDMTALMEFAKNSPYNVDSIGPALSRVMQDQAQFAELQLAIREQLNNTVRPLVGTRHEVTVMIGDNRKSVAFHIGQPNEEPIGFVLADLIPIEGKLYIGKRIPEFNQRRAGSPLQNLVIAGPIAGRDLASRLILVCDRVTSDRIRNEINQHVRTCNAGDPLHCWYRFSIQGNELVIEVMPGITVTTNDYPRLVYRLEASGGLNNPTTVIGDLLGVHPSIGSAHRRGSPYGSPESRWGGGRWDRFSPPDMGMMHQGYPYFPNDPFGESFGYPRFSIPRWGMYSVPEGFGGYRRGDGPMNISMPCRSFQEIEPLVELLAERSPAIHPQLSLLQPLMHTGSGTAEDPFQTRQFVFSIQPYPVGSMVTLAEYDYSDGQPISKFMFIVRQ